MKILTPVKEAFNEVFPPAAGEIITKISHTISYLTKQLIISGDTAKLVKDSFFVFFSIIKFGFKTLGGVVQIVQTIIKKMSSIDLSIFKPITDAISRTIQNIVDLFNSFKMDYNKR